jgi:hypothetical protein
MELCSKTSENTYDCFGGGRFSIGLWARNVRGEFSQYLIAYPQFRTLGYQQIKRSSRFLMERGICNSGTDQDVRVQKKHLTVRHRHTVLRGAGLDVRARGQDR